MLEVAETPLEIEIRSFQIIDQEIPEPRPYAGYLWEVARRCIHTVGDPNILDSLILQESALLSGLKALSLGCTIYTDTRMATCALPDYRFKPLHCQVKSIMDLDQVGSIASKHKITRAKAGMLLIKDNLKDQIVVIGNAPTALLTLLDILDQGAPPPALIVGMPVGFVNASQSKELLYQSPYPYFTLLGRRGGSAIAAACINALAEIVLRGK